MIQRILSVLKAANHVILAAHVNPDGDAMGALASMAYFCEYFCIPYTILLEKVPESFSYLIKDLNWCATWEKSVDTFVALDCGDSLRLGSYEKYFKEAKKTVCIDHHATNIGFAEVNYIREEASSTSELIFNLIDEAQIPLSKNIAEALYTGLVTDTGGFMHSCTHPSTHRVAARLLEVPFDFSSLYYTLIHEKSEKEVYLQAVVTSHMIKLCEGKVFLSYLTQEDLDAYEATREDASSIVTTIKNIKGCEIATFIYPDKLKGAYKVSFRSNAPYNVAEIASQFGGGGHVRAAGATVKGELIEVIEEIKKYLNF